MSVKTLTESDVMYAALHSMSNKEAADFLRIGRGTWKKYASTYYEPTTGKNYYDYLRVKRHIKTKKPRRINEKGFTGIDKILRGLQPSYSKKKLEIRLIKEGHFLPRCEMCGFDECNILTQQPPIILDCIDGNDTNFERDNLRYLCYNCAFNIGYKFKIVK